MCETMIGQNSETGLYVDGRNWKPWTFYMTYYQKLSQVFSCGNLIGLCVWDHDQTKQRNWVLSSKLYEDGNREFGRNGKPWTFYMAYSQKLSHVFSCENLIERMNATAEESSSAQWLRQESHVHNFLATPLSVTDLRLAPYLRSVGTIHGGYFWFTEVPPHFAHMCDCLNRIFPQKMDWKWKSEVTAHLSDLTPCEVCLKNTCIVQRYNVNTLRERSAHYVMQSNWDRDMPQDSRSNDWSL
jgi:hypothetical protein